MTMDSIRNLYIDFEYIESQDKTYFALICGVIYDSSSKEIYKFDLRYGYDSIVDYLSRIDLSRVKFLAYNVTTAEVPVLCQIMGRQWVQQTRWVDLWVEFKMFALTHKDYFTSSTGLANALKLLQIQDSYAADKEATRDVILYDKSQSKIAEKAKRNRLQTNSFVYTDKEFEQILHYCEQDVLILPKLAAKIVDMSKIYPIEPAHRLQRGRHCKYAGISYYFHNGYKMDVDRVKTIFQNVSKIKNSLKINCNEQTGFEIYKPQYKGPRKKKVLVGYPFNMENFGEYLKTKALYETWERTKTGLKLDEDYFDEMLSRHKDILEPVYNARNTIKQLSSTNLADLLTPQGYIKSVSWPFNQKTSRTSPKPKLGFILNLTPWLRMLIKPAPGKVFVGIDFKSQEVLIAACLSLDDVMLTDYLTDIYMGQAINTGFAPEGATKKTHPLLREGFKPIVLGVGFGMQAESLAIRFFNMFKLLSQEKTMNECAYEAKRFLQAHERAYHKYYDNIKRHFTTSKIQHYYQSLDNWFYFVDKNTRPTQLVNIPCQAGGAAITRLAHDRCVAKGIDVIQLHDALYFECDEDKAYSQAKVVSQIMVDSSAQILGYDYMSTETKIFTHESGYYDPRGEQIYRFVMKELQLECPEKFKKPSEILNIHKI